MQTAAEKRAHAREYESAKRKQRTAEGRCVRCGVKLEDGNGHALCPECRAKFGEYLRERRKWFRLSGACIWCGRIAREGRVLCEKCARSMAESERKRREVGNAEY